jgi:hypothetical protein
LQLPSLCFGKDIGGEMTKDKDKNKLLKERALWVGSAFVFLILSSVLGYVVSGLETAKMNLHELKGNQEADKVQWAKISLMREDYWKSQVAQAYKNGCMETAIKFLEKGK